MGQRGRGRWRGERREERKGERGGEREREEKKCMGEDNFVQGGASWHGSVG